MEDISFPTICNRRYYGYDPEENLFDSKRLFFSGRKNSREPSIRINM